MTQEVFALRNGAALQGDLSRAGLPSLLWALLTYTPTVSSLVMSIEEFGNLHLVSFFKMLAKVVNRRWTTFS